MSERRKIQVNLDAPPPGSPFSAYLVFFLKMPIPLVIFAVLVVLLVARIVVGDWSLLDLWLVLGLLAAYPFIEWFAHKVILHLGPFTIGGRDFDLGPAANHRAHHKNPEDLTKTLPDTTRNLLVVVIGTAIPTILILRSVGPILTVMCFVVFALLNYEWSHYLMHTNYRGWVLRRVRKAHLLHHYHNQDYWYGIATRAGDFFLRTNPAQTKIPLMANAPAPPEAAIG